MLGMSDSFEKIKDVDGDSEIKTDLVETSPKTPVPSVEADKERFGNLMKGGDTPEMSPQAPQKVGKTTWMDVVQELNQSNTVKAEITPDALLAQTKQASTRIDAIKETLESPNVGIRSPTHVQLLENKLVHINDNLKIALSKVGSEFSPEAAASIEDKPRVNPIERFLSFLSDGQTQLAHLGDELQSMSINKKEMAPVAMLAVQVKVGQIQQELELFSNLLNQALQSIKTVMNIQV
jgi:hypothetical protein